MVLSQPESIMLEDLQVSKQQAVEIEVQTRLQSDTALWHKLREKAQRPFI